MLQEDVIKYEYQLEELIIKECFDVFMFGIIQKDVELMEGMSWVYVDCSMGVCFIDFIEDV